MTRPMPGPPDCYDIDWDPTWGMVRVHCPGKWTRAFNHAELDKKRLTDAECAAEYWRASYHLDIPLATRTFVLTPEWVRDLNRTTTLRRFATRPHALEEA